MTETDSSTVANAGESTYSDCLPHIKNVLHLLSSDETLLNLGIYTVPPRFQSPVNDDALCPRIVSIGHFHNGTPGLLAMHEQKLFYLSFLLHRTGAPQHIFDECCKEISNATKFKMYAQYFKSDSLPVEKLVEILLIDGCFVFELLLRFSYPDLVDPKDPIFKNTWFMPTLQHDLLLLQNQVPMFVLQILVKKIKIISSKAPLCSNCDLMKLSPDFLCSLAHKFFSSIVRKIIHPPSLRDTEEFFHSDCVHFLDMMHDTFKPPDRSTNGKDQYWKVPIHGEGKVPKLGHCTQRLLAAGVKIERAENKHLLDLSFDGRTLRIPPLFVGLNTWSVLKNLVVWEQCGVDRSHHVTSYAVVLKNLIRTTRDVELLVEKGILEVDLDGGYDRVLAFVDCVVSGTVIRDFTYQRMIDELNAHRDHWWRWRKRKASWKLSWHRYKRALVTDYFPNPWRVVQIVVAFLLLALTALQTVYTVLGYY